jgi:hypothetical protein
MSEHKNNDQADVFERLRNRVKDLMQRFGVPDSLSRDGDYAVHGDYNGHPQVVVFVGNLELLRPKIVDELQKVIREFPGWEIDVTVAIRGHYSDWPNMGLYIRPHEIIDGLQRQYFPKELQNIEYEGSSKGTKYD